MKRGNSALALATITLCSKGLKVGERVVTSANFLIDSESQLQAALGSFVPLASGAEDTAGTMTAQQATLDLTSTVPNPPRKGSNRLRVRITDASHQAGAGRNRSYGHLVHGRYAGNGNGRGARGLSFLEDQVAVGSMRDRRIYPREARGRSRS